MCGLEMLTYEQSCGMCWTHPVNTHHWLLFTSCVCWVSDVSSWAKGYDTDLFPTAWTDSCEQNYLHFASHRKQVLISSSVRTTSREPSVVIIIWHLGCVSITWTNHANWHLTRMTFYRSSCAAVHTVFFLIILLTLLPTETYAFGAGSIPGTFTGADGDPGVSWCKLEYSYLHEKAFHHGGKSKNSLPFLYPGTLGLMFFSRYWTHTWEDC